MPDETLSIFGNSSGYLLGSQRNRRVNGNSIEGRGIPGTWTRQEESQQIYLLGKGHAEALQMLELSKCHTVASESNLWGGLHAAHSLSKQQPRETASMVTGQRKPAGFLQSLSHSVLHESKALGDRSGDVDGLQGLPEECVLLMNFPLE